MSYKTLSRFEEFLNDNALHNVDLFELATEVNNYNTLILVFLNVNMLYFSVYIGALTHYSEFCIDIVHPHNIVLP